MWGECVEQQEGQGTVLVDVVVGDGAEKSGGAEEGQNRGAVWRGGDD